MPEFKPGDRVMVMLGPDHPSRGTVLTVTKEKNKERVQVDLDVLWPPDRTEIKWYDAIELMLIKG